MGLFDGIAKRFGKKDETDNSAGDAEYEDSPRDLPADAHSRRMTVRNGEYVPAEDDGHLERFARSSASGSGDWEPTVPNLNTGRPAPARVLKHSGGSAHSSDNEADDSADPAERTVARSMADSTQRAANTAKNALKGAGAMMGNALYSVYPGKSEAASPSNAMPAQRDADDASSGDEFIDDEDWSSSAPRRPLSAPSAMHIGKQRRAKTTATRPDVDSRPLESAGTFEIHSSSPYAEVAHLDFKRNENIGAESKRNETNGSPRQKSVSSRFDRTPSSNGGHELSMKEKSVAQERLDAIAEDSQKSATKVNSPAGTPERSGGFWTRIAAVMSPSTTQETSKEAQESTRRREKLPGAFNYNDEETENELGNRPGNAHLANRMTVYHDLEDDSESRPPLRNGAIPGKPISAKMASPSESSRPLTTMQPESHQAVTHNNRTVPNPFEEARESRPEPPPRNRTANFAHQAESSSPNRAANNYNSAHEINVDQRMTSHTASRVEARPAENQYVQRADSHSKVSSQDVSASRPIPVSRADGGNQESSMGRYSSNQGGRSNSPATRRESFDEDQTMLDETSTSAEEPKSEKRSFFGVKMPWGSSKKAAQEQEGKIEPESTGNSSPYRTDSYATEQISQASYPQNQSSRNDANNAQNNRVGPSQMQFSASSPSATYREGAENNPQVRFESNSDQQSQSGPRMETSKRQAQAELTAANRVNESREEVGNYSQKESLKPLPPRPAPPSRKIEQPERQSKGGSNLDDHYMNQNTSDSRFEQSSSQPQYTAASQFRNDEGTSSIMRKSPPVKQYSPSGISTRDGSQNPTGTYASTRESYDEDQTMLETSPETSPSAADKPTSDQRAFFGFKMPWGSSKKPAQEQDTEIEPMRAENSSPYKTNSYATGADQYSNPQKPDPEVRNTMNNRFGPNSDVDRHDSNLAPKTIQSEAPRHAQLAGSAPSTPYRDGSEKNPSQARFEQSYVQQSAPGPRTMDADSARPVGSERGRIANEEPRGQFHRGYSRQEPPSPMSGQKLQGNSPTNRANDGGNDKVARNTPGSDVASGQQNWNEEIRSSNQRKETPVYLQNGGTRRESYEPNNGQHFELPSSADQRENTESRSMAHKTEGHMQRDSHEYGSAQRAQRVTQEKISATHQEIKEQVAHTRQEQPGTRRDMPSTSNRLEQTGKSASPRAPMTSSPLALNQLSVNREENYANHHNSRYGSEVSENGSSKVNSPQKMYSGQESIEKRQPESHLGRKSAEDYATAADTRLEPIGNKPRTTEQERKPLTASIKNWFGGSGLKQRDEVDQEDDSIDYSDALSEANSSRKVRSDSVESIGEGLASVRLQQESKSALSSTEMEIQQANRYQLQPSSPARRQEYSASHQEQSPNRPRTVEQSSPMKSQFPERTVSKNSILAVQASPNREYDSSPQQRQDSERRTPSAKHAGSSNNSRDTVIESRNANHVDSSPSRATAQNHRQQDAEYYSLEDVTYNLPAPQPRNSILQRDGTRKTGAQRTSVTFDSSAARDSAYYDVEDGQHKHATAVATSEAPKNRLASPPPNAMMFPATSPSWQRPPQQQTPADGGESPSSRSQLAVVLSQQRAHGLRRPMEMDAFMELLECSRDYRDSMQRFARSSERMVAALGVVQNCQPHTEEGVRHGLRGNVAMFHDVVNLSAKSHQTLGKFVYDELEAPLTQTHVKVLKEVALAQAREKQNQHKIGSPDQRNAREGKSPLSLEDRVVSQYMGVVIEKVGRTTAGALTSYVNLGIGMQLMAESQRTTSDVAREAVALFKTASSKPQQQRLCDTSSLAYRAQSPEVIYEAGRIPLSASSRETVTLARPVRTESLGTPKH